MYLLSATGPLAQLTCLNPMLNRSVSFETGPLAQLTYMRAQGQSSTALGDTSIQDTMTIYYHMLKTICFNLV